MLLVTLLAACVPHVPTQASDIAPAPASPIRDWSAPGPIQHEAVVSARWAVPLHGLVNLDDPRAAELDDGDHPIVLPVHVLTHPEHGVFVVDTGMPAADSPARGLVARFIRDIEVVEPLADIVDRQPLPLAGVLLTHGHIDHVLGLPDVPDGVPIYAGPGEHVAHRFTDRFALGTLRRALGDRALDTWRFEEAGALGPIDAAIDVLGDGSLWALHVPGHTLGSTAYLAFTAQGPKLFTGDCSHTRWGWDHGVTPGTYTVDHDTNQVSLDALKALVAEHPEVEVFVGHEL